MAQVIVTDKATARRCKQAFLDRRPIAFTQAVGDETKVFSGQVQSVEEDRSGPRKWWRVTIVE